VPARVASAGSAIDSPCWPLRASLAERQAGMNIVIGSVILIIGGAAGPPTAARIRPARWHCRELRQQRSGCRHHNALHARSDPPGSATGQSLPQRWYRTSGLRASAPHFPHAHQGRPCFPNRALEPLDMVVPAADFGRRCCRAVRTVSKTPLCVQFPFRRASR